MLNISGVVPIQKCDAFWDPLLGNLCVSLLCLNYAMFFRLIDIYKRIAKDM